jgi:hypothetical protein
VTGQVEYGDRSRGGGTFPQWWGFPEGRGDSEERVSWAVRSIATDQALERRGLNAAEVRSGKRSRTMTGTEALAKVRRLQRLT